MAPGVKRTASQREEDIDESSQQTEPSSQQSVKKSKKGLKAEESTEYVGCTNNALPDKIEFPAKTPNTLRLAAWNVSGLAASEKKGFSKYVTAEDADILIITETKLSAIPSNGTLKEKYPHQYWSFATKKGYSGTAILSKQEALSRDDTIPNHPNPQEVKGRIITLEFSTCYVVGTYVVNAGVGLKTLDEKKLWNTHFFAYLHELDKKKPVIWVGDLNVAPSAIDLARAKPNWNKTPGYTEAETSAFNDFLNPAENSNSNKFLDIWRHRNPDKRKYTYFSYRFNCRAKGLGWRIDGFVLSDRLESRIKMCEIRDEIYGASDHVPVAIEIEGPL